MRGRLLQDPHIRLLVLGLRHNLGLEDVLQVIGPGLVRWRKPLDVISHVSDWLLLLLLVHLVLHGLEVEGDGLVLPLDGVRVHLDNLH